MKLLVLFSEYHLHDFQIKVTFTTYNNYWCALIYSSILFESTFGLRIKYTP